MGDPKKQKKKYESPSHPWQRVRIDEEAELMKKYAPKNKKEIWKMATILKDFKDQAKKLSSLNTEQAKKETKMLVKKLVSMGLIKEGDGSEKVLILTLGDIMERRLQTMTVKKGVARTIKQARQFITHAHIKVDNKVITSPSYLVKSKEEDKITFKNSSPFVDAEHPERKVVVKVVEKKEEKKEDTRQRRDGRKPREYKKSRKRSEAK
jgi:small subunit ribosomal protein S4